MIKKFIVNQVGKVVRSGGQIATEELAKARLEVCKGCDKIGKVGLKGYPLVSVEGCTICKCPLVTKTKTLTHRDYSNNIYKASKNLKNLIDILNKNNVPFVRTQCDLGKWLQTDINFLGIQRIIELDMSTVKSIGDFGKKRANSNALVDNAMRLDDTSNTSLSTQDKVTILDASGKTITNIKFNKIDHAISVAADDVEAVQKAIYDIVNKYENKVFVKAETVGNDTVVTHIGQLRLETITANSTAYSGVVKSSLITSCVSVAFLESAKANAPTIIIKDEEGTELVNKTMGNDYSTVNETNRAAFETELGTAVSPYGPVNIKIEGGKYKIILALLKGWTATIEGEEFVVDNCFENFI